MPAHFFKGEVALTDLHSRTLKPHSSLSATNNVKNRSLLKAYGLLLVASFLPQSSTTSSSTSSYQRVFSCLYEFSPINLWKLVLLMLSIYPLYHAQQSLKSSGMGSEVFTFLNVVYSWS